MLTDLLNSVHEQNQPELCILSGFEGYSYSPSGAAFTKATVTQAGRVAKIKIYQGSGSQLAPNLIGQELSFSLKSYQAKNGLIYISGFWNERAQQPKQQGYQAPQSTPQTHQMPPQATNAPQGMDIQGQIMEMAERFLVAIEQLSFPNAITPMRPTQPSAPNPDWVGEDPTPPDDSDIPF